MKRLIRSYLLGFMFVLVAFGMLHIFAVVGDYLPQILLQLMHGGSWEYVVMVTLLLGTAWYVCDSLTRALNKKKVG